MYCHNRTSSSVWTLHVCSYHTWFAASWRKRSKKVSQTTSNPRVSSFVNTDSPPPQAKAYTHHALLARQRPPLQFYTVRSDPRDQGLAAGAVPMGPFRRPTSMGRPVLYLDMLDPAMNENNAMPHYGKQACVLMCMFTCSLLCLTAIRWLSWWLCLHSWCVTFPKPYIPSIHKLCDYVKPFAVGK